MAEASSATVSTPSSSAAGTVTGNATASGNGNGEGSQNGNDNLLDSNTKAPKDRNCPFCNQAFTSSSLGRHLDLYIKPKVLEIARPCSLAHFTDTALSRTPSPPMVSTTWKRSESCEAASRDVSPVTAFEPVPTAIAERNTRTTPPATGAPRRVSGTGV